MVELAEVNIDFDKMLFQVKNDTVYILYLCKNICWGSHWKCLNETLQMSAHNIYFF